MRDIYCDIIRQLASGLAHLHSFGFAHGKLNPDNIMYVTKDKVNLFVQPN